MVGTVGALMVRRYFALRRLGFSLAPDGVPRRFPGPSLRRIKAVARALLANIEARMTGGIRCHDSRCRRCRVVVPVRNEAGNIAPLVAEIAARARRALAPSRSSMSTTARPTARQPNCKRLMAQHPWLRRVRHAQSCGQSAAVRTGVRAARAPLIVTLDGDGQNDPAFMPALVARAGSGRAAHRAGCRPARRPQGDRLQEAAIAHRQRACAARCCATARATPAAD